MYVNDDFAMTTNGTQLASTARALQQAGLHRITICLVASHAGVVRFFFFQAEDGIRDVAVTGVQTCALPIYLAARGLVERHPQVLRALFDELTRADRLAQSARQEAVALVAGFSGLDAAVGDRKSGVEGKRVELGGCRIIKKKKKEKRSCDLTS